MISFSEWFPIFDVCCDRREDKSNGKNLMETICNCIKYVVWAGWEDIKSIFEGNLASTKMDPGKCKPVHFACHLVKLVVSFIR